MWGGKRLRLDSEVLRGLSRCCRPWRFPAEQPSFENSSSTAGQQSEHFVGACQLHQDIWQDEAGLVLSAKPWFHPWSKGFQLRAEKTEFQTLCICRSCNIFTIIPSYICLFFCVRTTTRKGLVELCDSQNCTLSAHLWPQGKQGSAKREILLI